jgi:hypothetical protein
VGLGIGGDHHPAANLASVDQVAMAHQRVAAEYEQLDRYAAARLREEKSLDTYRLNLGEEHPHTFVAESNLALNHVPWGCARDAIPFDVHIYKVRQRIFVPDSVEMEFAQRLLHVDKVALDQD